MQRSPWEVRYFLDTEFKSFDDCQLISLAIVGEDGREFYAECSDFDRALCSDFVNATVGAKRRLSREADRTSLSIEPMNSL
jgi:hypothetical protein